MLHPAMVVDVTMDMSMGFVPWHMWGVYMTGIVNQPCGISRQAV